MSRKKKLLAFLTFLMAFSSLANDLIILITSVYSNISFATKDLVFQLNHPLGNQINITETSVREFLIK